LSSATSEIPGYVPGSWRIDPERSTLKFSVAHLGLHTVHGTLAVQGQLIVGDDPASSTVAALIDVGSVATGSNRRDTAIRSPAILDIENHPTAAYRSTGVARDHGADDPRAFVLDGELTLLGVTRAVPLRIHVQGFVTEGGGVSRPVVTGRGQFARRDFGLVYHVRPQFLDRAIGPTVGVEVRLEGSPRSING
jgi:polyisoprenoid-binding protein YceI